MSLWYSHPWRAHCASSPPPSVEEVRAHLECFWSKETDTLRMMYGSFRDGIRLSPNFSIFFMDVVAVPPSKFRPPARTGESTKSVFLGMGGGCMNFKLSHFGAGMDILMTLR